MANDLSTHSVMAVLDTAIHALLFESRRLDESQPRLIGIKCQSRFNIRKVFIAATSSNKPD
jgi:hypothetical protein